MPKRVLLISTNRCTTPDPVFPLGLAHLSQALRTAGHQTCWYDAQASQRPFPQVLEEFQPDLAGISIRNIDDVLIRKRETYYDDVAALASEIRRSARCPIVVGGSGFSIFPKELLKFSGADFGICGAGELPLLALMDALENRTDYGSISGLVFRRGSEIVVNAPSADAPMSLGIIANTPVECSSYYIRTGGMLNVQTQRGCAFHCCYCTYPLIEGRAHRRHSPEAVAKEFAAIQNAGAKYVFIVDSVFNSTARHVAEICEAILRRGVKLSWGCFLRPQGLIPELMRLMARAGLKHIEFGSDSFSDSVLSSYQKGLTFEDIRHSSELARKENIDYCHFLIAGGPGETDATLDEGFQRSKCLDGAVIMAVVGMRIYPGTTLFDRAVAEGVIERDQNLLRPVYYVSPGLTPDHVFARITEFASKVPNWIVGDPVPGYANFVQRLRQRGVEGPLWSYLPLLQRFWPAGGLGSKPATSLTL